ESSPTGLADPRAPTRASVYEVSFLGPRDRIRDGCSGAIGQKPHRCRGRAAVLRGHATASNSLGRVSVKFSRVALVTLALSMGPVAVVRAQDQGGRRGGDRPSFVDQLKEALGLTDEQLTKVKALDESFRAEMKKIRDENQGGDWSAMREKMQPV